MPTIVMNTLRAAVTEWTLDAKSISPSHVAGASGLLAFGGDDDDGTPIAARFLLPETDQGSPARKHIGEVLISGDMPASDTGQVLVKADGEEYDYSLHPRSDGISRATPGRGLWPHRVGIGYANQEGQDFRIDRLDADITASKRSLK